MRKWLKIKVFRGFEKRVVIDLTTGGTRPPTMDEYEQYEAHHKSRLATKPGLTGTTSGGLGDELFGIGMKKRTNYNEFVRFLLEEI